MAFTIGPHHATPTIPTKVNSFHISPSFGYHVDGILLETSTNAIPRPLTMTPRGDDKKTPGTKTPSKTRGREGGRRLLAPGPAWNFRCPAWQTGNTAGTSSAQTG